MRCNAGVNPLYLTDSHLIAEYRELCMVIGSLDYWKWEIKSEIREVFNLGAGHMNFFKVRLKYLYRRHEAVKSECRRRNFKCDYLSIRLNECKPEFCQDWVPTMDDSIKIRNRIIEKLKYRFELSPRFWKYERRTIIDMINNGELFYV